MNRLRFRPIPLLSIAALLFFAGCGYHLVGTGSALPSHIKTVAIPVFENSSGQPDIQREITSAIRLAFINDGRLKVVDEKKANLLLSGDVNYYDIRVVSFDSADSAAEYIVQIGVAIDVHDQVKNKRFMKQKFRTKWDYRASSDVVGTEFARLAALDEAYRELANQLVSIIIEQF